MATPLEVKESYIKVPLVTTLERNALAAANGMLVYDTDLNAFYKYENGSWSTFAGGSAYSRTVVSGNLTATNDTDYTLVASATFTDPTPVEGKGYTVLLRNGTATLGGNAYSTVGQLLWRAYHSGAWATYQLVTQTQLDAKEPTITWAQGDLLYGTGVNTYAKLAKNTTSTRYLSNTGANNNPAWSQIDLSNGVTGVLPSANGGSSAWVDYSATTTVTGFSSTTTTRVWYQVNYKAVTVFFFIIGTSNATTFTFTLPNAHTSNYNGTYIGSFSRNNGITLTTPPGIFMSASSTTVDLYRDIAQTAWTNSGDKRCAGSFTYQID